MIRKIIHIDEEKCNGCGSCAEACHEGAIGMSNGKAKLLRDDYCDGLGDCLPACPVNAISFTEREAEVFNCLVNTEDNVQTIAESLYVSRRTLERYISAIYEKTGVKSRVGLLNLYNK